MLLVNIKLFDINFKKHMRSLEVYLCDLPHTIFERLGASIFAIVGKITTM